MNNPFKKAVENLMKDFEDYDYILGDMETFEFYNNNYLNYINNTAFIESFPITHQFLVIVSIIYYTDILDGSWYVEDRKAWELSFDDIVMEYLENVKFDKSIINKILLWVRNACVDFLNEWDYNKDYEGHVLMNAKNALIPIMKYLYSISDEFK